MRCPNRIITVLCGHPHSPGFAPILDNGGPGQQRNVAMSANSCAKAARKDNFKSKVTRS